MDTFGLFMLCTGSGLIGLALGTFIGLEAGRKETR